MTIPSSGMPSARPADNRLLSVVLQLVVQTNGIASGASWNNTTTLTPTTYRAPRRFTAPVQGT